MGNELIKALKASSLATEDKNKAVLTALDFSLKCDREQIEWNNKLKERFTFKPIDHKGAEVVVWLGVAVSALSIVVGLSVYVWNYGL